MTERIDVVKDLGWNRDEIPFSDSDMSHLLLFVERFYDLTSDKNVEKALDVVVRTNQYHPIVDYLNALEWDGTERIRYALHHFLGADTSDITYESMKVFLLGCVMILSILVDTFISKISLTMQPGPKIDSISGA